MKEISLERLISALRTRLREVPHVLAWQLSSTAAENKKNLQKYQGIHKGKRCFIVANGPSLRKTDLELLRVREAE